MADRCDRCVAVVHTDSEAVCQAADILVCVVASPELAGPAIARLLADYPGCAAVAAVVPRAGDPLCPCLVEALADRGPR